MLQGAGVRWLGELAVRESKHARVNRPCKFARGTNETRQGCKKHERGGSANLRYKNVNSNELADPARLLEARARWLGELAVQEMNLARVSRPGKTQQGCRRHERGGSENLRCRKVNTHGLADPASLQGARTRQFEELAVQESKLARISRPGKIARGTREVAWRTCETRQDCKRHERGGSANLRRRKLSSHEARLQEARGRWLGELAAQEIKLARVSRSGKVARSTGEVARRTYEAGK
ncbi:hypothetical protein CDL15_Pgr022308 [Punica granatum]|uniref:Uncharacterized protein n=1 Tax=Punica granatum TaxID=22663 RepID=A0A218W4D6_PUNGR|nr:hypothetical protein CDL15_Pgr022308 [Punica granatum]